MKSNQKTFQKEKENKLIKIIDKSIKNQDIIIVSDYNKGVITKTLSEYIIKKANSLNLPIVIDPKNKDFSIYRNAYFNHPKSNGSIRNYANEIRKQYRSRKLWQNDDEKI